MKKHSSLEWSKYFYLCDSSPTGIRWAVFNRAIKPESRRYKGDIAGFKKSIGGGKHDYYRVKVCGTNYAVHRIVWEMRNGTIPDGHVVNHKDGDTFNNSVDNLETCPQIHNMRRRKDHSGRGVSRANKTGVTGVSFSVKWNKERTGKVEYFVAYYTNPLTSINESKHFRIDTLGKEVAFAFAVDWRESNIRAIQDKGYGYESPLD